MSKSLSSNYKRQSHKSSNSDLTIEFILPLLRGEAEGAEGSCLPCRTALEWAKIWSVGHNKARYIVRKLLELGYLRRATKRIETIAGIMARISCFEPTEKALGRQYKESRARGD